MIDIICCNPRDCLYPWFMRKMNNERHRFGKIIVIMTQQATEYNFTNYIKDNIKDVTIIEEYVDDGKDWRNAAITEALKISDGDRILFLEQDFLFDQDFLDRTLSIDANTIGFYQGDRLHPAFLLVKRFILEKTRKDFSVDPDKGDHFSKLTKDLREIGGIYLLPDDNSWYHLAGLTQNYRMTSHWYQPQIFSQYNKLSQDLPQHELWKGICHKKEVEMGEFSPHPLVNLNRYFYNMKYL